MMSILEGVPRVRARSLAALVAGGLVLGGGVALGALAGDVSTDPIRGGMQVPADPAAPGADTVPVPGATPDCPIYDLLEPAEEIGAHAFHFARAIYTSGFGGGWRMSRRGSWSIDFPKSDRQFLFVLSRLLDIHAFPCETPVRLDDPRLREFPFLYMVEPGQSMSLTLEEIEGLRSYLLAGGFMLVDDFWGTYEWANFEREMREVLPDRPIVEIPRDHPVFHIGFQVDDIVTVPSIGNARRGVYHERDGTIPYMLGIFDEDTGRLMVAIAWNTDLGDAWEWAEQPDYPRDRSDYAFKMGVNFVLYAMTH